MKQKINQMDFKDHFSGHAASYCLYRPHYPQALFEYLASLVLEPGRAWDCGTGNGQAAVNLAPYFKQVVATDPSEKQISNAIAKDNISYSVQRAEKTSFAAHSMELVTVAQALHWFDIPNFYREAQRVLKPQGVIAVWGYTLMEISPEIDQIVREYCYRIVGDFWPPERRLLDEKYASVPFPFGQLSTPNFFMEQTWSMNHLMGYLNTWSSTKNFIAQNQTNPLKLIEENLKFVWGEPETPKLTRWSLHLKVGRKKVKSLPVA